MSVDGTSGSPPAVIRAGRQLLQVYSQQQARREPGRPQCGPTHAPYAWTASKQLRETIMVVGSRSSFRLKTHPHPAELHLRAVSQT